MSENNFVLDFSKVKFSPALLRSYSEQGLSFVPCHAVQRTFLDAMRKLYLDGIPVEKQHKFLRITDLLEISANEPQVVSLTPDDFNMLFDAISTAVLPANYIQSTLINFLSEVRRDKLAEQLPATSSKDAKV